MRFVIYGAGAIGGVIGGRLFEAGHDVTLVARGVHGHALSQDGLELVSPVGSVKLPIPTVGHPSEFDWSDGGGDRVVLLAVKSQDTATAVDTLAASAPPQTAVVCAQNGVENERAALRSFADVYAMTVMCPATHLDPGRVLAHSAPVAGLLDLGRYPAGVNWRAEAIAEALRESSFSSEARTDILRWKYRKLVLNLANAVIALCGPSEGVRPLLDVVWAEGEACLAAAGIDLASRDEDRARRGDLLTVRPVAGIERPGGSSWQSLARGTGHIEADYLNGEIVLLGRLHGVPTPGNQLLQRLANEAARNHQPPGHLTVDEILTQLDRG
jgi:2-dehydropantoate 2-reductase